MPLQLPGGWWHACRELLAGGPLPVAWCTAPTAAGCQTLYPSNRVLRLKEVNAKLQEDKAGLETRALRAEEALTASRASKATAVAALEARISHLKAGGAADAARAKQGRELESAMKELSKVRALGKRGGVCGCGAHVWCQTLPSISQITSTALCGCRDPQSVPAADVEAQIYDHVQQVSYGPHLRGVVGHFLCDAPAVPVCPKCLPT